MNSGTCKNLGRSRDRSTLYHHHLGGRQLCLRLGLFALAVWLLAEPPKPRLLSTQNKVLLPDTDANTKHQAFCEKWFPDGEQLKSVFCSPKEFQQPRERGIAGLGLQPGVVPGQPVPEVCCSGYSLCSCSSDCHPHLCYSQR